MLHLPEEQRLVEAMNEAREKAEPAIAREDFAGAMAALARLRGPVDEFFDKVTVNSDDAARAGQSAAPALAHPGDARHRRRLLEDRGLR